MKKDLAAIWRSPGGGKSHFAAKDGAKDPTAVECLEKNRPPPLAFYDFPAEHTRERRTRSKVSLPPPHRADPGCAVAAQRMVFKRITAAAKTGRRLKGENQVPKVIRGVTFVDGVTFIEPTAQHAA